MAISAIIALSPPILPSPPAMIADSPVALTDDSTEGIQAFLEKREPDWGAYPWHF